MKYETFCEKFNELDTATKIRIYNEYCLEYGYSENYLSYFDEEFFDTYLPTRMESARAAFFGHLNWGDELIRLDAYGNLESLDYYDAEQEIDNYTEEIYNCQDIWEDYIEDDDEEEEEEE